ncbi:MAG TPA: DUF1353 domain-containing protein [Gemmatimonadaceae bacterium]|nr:DUF1353 domain-containing protein [Gemmatimonadaceae bacterium]
MSAAFLSPLRVEKCQDGRWKLLEPLAFHSVRFRGIFVAPAGFVTDFASTPRALWFLYPKDGPWSRASVFHDAGYHHALLTARGQPVHLIKAFSDELFLEGLVADGVRQADRVLMYRAVCWFGKGRQSRSAIEAEAHHD